MGATCRSGTCECPGGQHTCGNTCVSSTSTQSCGSVCAACPSTTSGVTTCDGNTCGRTCDAGFRLCGSTCASCSTPANATAMCTGSTCDFTCVGGFHRCGNQCLPNLSTDSCGSSCSPCSAPAGATPSCTSSVCGFTCDAGRRLCGGACPTCNTPAHATPVCNGTACDYTCDTGYHRCGNQCLADDSVDSCGMSCTACPTDPNGFALCSASSGCLLGCNSGAVQCGGSCAVCPVAPAHSSVGCLFTGQCDFTCDSGYHRCGTHCVANDSITECGPSCEACSTSFPNATATCQVNRCMYACGQGWLRCAAGCCRAATISGGLAITCATTPAGDALCWGSNYYNNTSTPQLLGLADVATISTSGSRSCLLTTAGAVTCLDRSTSQWLTVAGLSAGVQRISTGANHTCALTTAGAVRCWGSNAEGQLGDGTTTDSATPVDVVGLVSGVTVLEAGSFHTCAVLGATGEVRCWGNNIRGVLGDGTTTNRSSPVTVASLGATAVRVSAGGNHTCAVLTGGTVKCWGRNISGELGNGVTANQSLVPVFVTGLTAVTDIDLGDRHSCARTMAGGLKCWGSNISGRLGDGTLTTRSTPVDVSGLTSGVVTFATGSEGTCVINTTGEVLCWGANSDGTVGDGTTTARYTPVYVLGRY